jgi:transcriptional regulator with XRE-family HTH domain
MTHYRTHVDFADHLRRLREERRMTCYRLAILSGMSTEGICKLEVPGSDPKLSTLYKLAGALGLTVHDLLPSIPVEQREANEMNQRTTPDASTPKADASEGRGERKPPHHSKRAKRSAVEMALKARPTASDWEIARHVGVSISLVGNVRRHLESNAGGG